MRCIAHDIKKQGCSRRPCCIQRPRRGWHLSDRLEAYWQTLTLKSGRRYPIWAEKWQWNTQPKMDVAYEKEERNLALTIISKKTFNISSFFTFLTINSYFFNFFGFVVAEGLSTALFPAVFCDASSWVLDTFGVAASCAVDFTILGFFSSQCRFSPRR